MNKSKKQKKQNCNTTIAMYNTYILVVIVNPNNIKVFFIRKLIIQ